MNGNSRKKSLCESEIVKFHLIARIIAPSSEHVVNFSTNHTVEKYLIESQLDFIVMDIWILVYLTRECVNSRVR